MTKETSKSEVNTRQHYYDNGQLRWRTNYKNDKRHGKRCEWYEDGQKKEEEKYKDDKRVGMKTCWYEDGQKKEEGNYKDAGPHRERWVKDAPNGKWTWWHKNGQKSKEGNYKKTTLKDLQEGYEHGYMREGTWTWWYENGQKEHQIDYDSKSCQRSHWNENGRMQEEDVEIEYYSDGSIKSKYELYEQYSARFTSYYSNGNIESLGEYFTGDIYYDKYKDYCEQIFSNYEPDAYDIAADKRPPYRMGAWNYWYENGLIKRQCSYAGLDFDGKSVRDGLYISYYKNGQKKIERTYKVFEVIQDHGWEIRYRESSMNDGVAIAYRRDGTKKIELNYKDGKKNGKFKVWDKNGQIVSEADIIIDQIKKKKDDLDEAW